MGLGAFMKFPAEVGPSISTMSVTVSVEGPAPVADEYPSTEFEFVIFSLLINGSEANAGGGLRDSVTDSETGWFPKTFFSMPVCTKDILNIFRSLLV